MIDRGRLFAMCRAPLFAFVAGVLVAAGAGLDAARAQAVDVFEVTGVDVDVTAETAAAARGEALVDGERRAFRRLLERLTLLADRDRLPEFTRDEITAYVKDFSIAEEKASAVRYLATLNFRFRAEDVRRLLIDNALPFAETASKPLLVLPVYQAAGALMLWDDPNPWRDAWAARSTVDGLVPLVLPLGDLSDIAAIGAEQAVKGDAQRLTAIAAKYRAGDTLVAHGILRLDTRRGLPDLEVYLTRFGTALQEQTVVRTFAAAGDESLDELLRRAAAVLAQQVEDNWKRDNLLQFGRPAVLAVTVRIKSLGDWLVVRKRLAGVAVIRRADLALLSRAEVRVNLHYIGESDQLTLALEQADLTLSREDDEWILGLRPASSTARARP